MDSSFPSNSQRARKPVPEKDTKRVPLEKIVTSGVIQRKKPLSRRFTETFIGGDAKSTALYVFGDILVPAAKDLLVEAVTKGMETMIFGESRSSGRRSNGRPGLSGMINYNRMSSTRQVREDPREISRRARSQHEFDEIILDTRAEGERVLETLDDLIERYGEATVSDLYELVGITSEHTDGKWGWSDLRTARVDKLRGEGYLLNLPKTNPIE